MAERTMIGYVRKGLTALGAHVVKHADYATPGVADISAYSACSSRTHWIELKELKEWPRRAETEVRLGEFTELQGLFLQRRHGWLFLRVNETREYFLFTAEAAHACFLARRGIPRAEFPERARAVWKGRVLWGEFWERIGA